MPFQNKTFFFFDVFINIILIIFQDLAKLLQHDALVVITMMLFASRKDLQLPEIDNPLAALHCFLESFSEIDWNSFHVTVLGIVPSTNETSDVIQRVSTSPLQLTL